MFTGIIQAKGSITAIENQGDDARLCIDAGKLDMADVVPGDSICVNGVCLTVTEMNAKGFCADVSGETLSRTCLSGLSANSPVNLEKSMLPTTRMGGHLVSGHVDGVAKIVERTTAGRSVQFKILVPETLAKYIAEKGSVCVDGVSLTVNAVSGAEFDINIIPHTLNETIIGEYKQGQSVNIEVDIVARYLERLLLGDDACKPGKQNITMEFLKEHGFTR